jgi:hypothetical protein
MRRPRRERVLALGERERLDRPGLSGRRRDRGTPNVVEPLRSMLVADADRIVMSR